MSSDTSPAIAPHAISPASSARRPRTLRPSAAMLLAALGLTLFAARLAALQGWLVPVRVVSGSMADTLLGPHWQVACPGCGYHVRYGVEYRRDDGLVLCPRCDTITSDTHARRRPGERVLIDRWIGPQGPGRWQIYAFRSELDEQVKRIVGLPGETVAIRDGDVWINGRLVRKSLAEMRSLAVLVADDRFRSDDGPAVWRPEADGSGWTVEPNGYLFGASAPDIANNIGGPLDWLRFDPRRRIPFPHGPVHSIPVLDDYGYNQSLSRESHAVHDLLLFGRFQFDTCAAVADPTGPVAFPRAGVLAIELLDGRDRFRIELDTTRGHVRLFHNDLLLVTRPGGRWPVPAPVWLEAALCDQQVFFAVDGILRLRHIYQPALPRDDVLRPLAIGARGVDVRATDLQVYRDVHYLHPFGVDWPWQAERALAADEYFVLGDNSPTSLDSRAGPDHFVRREDFLGRVLRLR